MPYRPKNSRFWHYDFQIRGRRFHGSCGTEDFETAKAIEAEARVAAKSVQKTHGRFTVSEALGTYWKDVCQHQPSSATAKSQARMLLEVLPGKLPIASVTTADLVTSVAKMRSRCKNGTVNRRLDLLARSFRHMERVHGSAVPEIDWKALKTPEPEERVREMSLEEQKRLLEAIRQDLRPLVLFALMTGARRAEICEMRWSDVNHETRRISIKGKGGKTRRLPMNAEIRALLSAMPRSRVLHARPHVFTYLSEDGERYPLNLTGGYIWQEWRAAVAAAGIADLRFHDLRHTFATRMLRQTGNLKLVSRLLGHSSIETTMRYAHVMDTDLEDAMEAFSACGKVASPEVSPEAERKGQ